MLQSIKNKLIGIVVSFFLLFSAPLIAETPNSLSDLSLDSFKTDQLESYTRNPFSPGATEGNLDPTSLSLEGIIVGAQKKFCLISGRTLKEGDAIGAFLIKEISPGAVKVQSIKGETRLPIKTYISQPIKKGDFYEIVFENAGLKEALRMIATAGGFNIIVPENQAGRVSLVFHNIALREALASILRVNNLEFAEENNIIRVGEPKDFAAGAFFSTEHIGLRYATAGDLVDTLKSHLSEKGTVTADTRTNTIIIKDVQSITDNVAKMVKRLDAQDTQVRIEAKILDVTKNFSRSLGIQWGFTKDTGQVQGFGASGAGSLTNPLNINMPATSPTSGAGILIGNLINGMDLEAQITAAEQRGDAHIISQPSVTTINNMPAKIRSGLKIYVKTTSSISVGGSGGTATSDDTGLEEIDTGVELTVTPQITTGNTVKLKIEAEESEADFTRTVDGIPAVSDNSASTTVLVNDGETTVIGGLMKTNRTTTSNRAPGLSSIPVLGWLFKSKTKVKIDNELLIFITPHIVKQRAFKRAVAKPSTSVEPVIEKKVVKPPSWKRHFRQSKYRR